MGRGTLITHPPSEGPTRAAVTSCLSTPRPFLYFLDELRRAANHPSAQGVLRARAPREGARGQEDDRSRRSGRSAEATIQDRARAQRRRPPARRKRVRHLSRSLQGECWRRALCPRPVRRNGGCLAPAPPRPNGPHNSSSHPLPGVSGGYLASQTYCYANKDGTPFNGNKSRPKLDPVNFLNTKANSDPN